MAGLGGIGRGKARAKAPISSQPAPGFSAFNQQPQTNGFPAPGTFDSQHQRGGISARGVLAARGHAYRQAQPNGFSGFGNEQSAPQESRTNDFTADRGRGRGNFSNFGDRQPNETATAATTPFGNSAFSGPKTNNNFASPGQGDDDGAAAAPERKPITYIPEQLKIDDLFLAEHITPGIDFDKFENDERLIPAVTGGGTKDRIRTFNEAALDEQVLGNITRAKYGKPTPIQSVAIPAILEGQDIMACAQTGSGKTAAFLLPIITWIKRNKDDSRNNFCEPYAIIVAPTRELQKQIFKEALKFGAGTGVTAVEVYGQTNMRDQIERIKKGCDIVTATIGRLNHLLKSAILYNKRVKFLVLDEADRMLKEGFEQTIRELCEENGMPAVGQRQTLMFSATFPPLVQHLAADYLNKNYTMIHIGKIGAANAQVVQNVIEVTHYQKKDMLLEILTKEAEIAEKHDNLYRYRKKTLVFFKTKRMADVLATWLSSNDIPTTSIHGDREQAQREEALKQFTEGFCFVLAATDVAARGLDIPCVDHVINFDLPDDIDQYVHRIGRTGRVGNMGRATAFFDRGNDSALAKPLVDCMAEAQQVIPDWLREDAGVMETPSISDRFGETTTTTTQQPFDDGTSWD